MGTFETLRDGADRLATDPSDPESIASLERLLDTPERLAAARLLIPAHERAGNQPGLVRALEVLSDASGQVAEKLTSLKRIAEIHLRQLHQPDLALATLAKGLALGPEDAALHRLAEEAAVEAGAVDVLVELLGDLLEGATGRSRAALHRQLGGLHARHLPDSGAAIEHLQRALAEWPEDLEVLDALRRQHEQREGWAALAEVTEKIARLQPDRALQVTAWRAAAALHETRLHDEESALECWLRVLELSSDTREAAEQVRRLLAAVPGHEQARAALDRLAPRPPPPPQGPTASDLLAGLQAFVSPGADRVKALPGLRRIAEQVDALDSLAEVVEAESEKVEEPAELAALLRFVAQLREELKQPRQAMVLWNDLLAVQPNDPEALEHLGVLLGNAGDSRNAGEVALRRARLSGRDRLARFAQAADFFLAAQSPGAAMQALDEALAAVPSADSLALGPIHLRRGKLLAQKDPALAVQALTQALRVRELEAQAAAELERLLAVPAVRAAAGAALEPYLRQLGDPRRLVEALEAQLETIAAPARRLRFVEIAKLWEQAKEPRAALGTLLRAFVLAPSNARVRVDLERLASSLDAKEELLAAYEEGLDNEPKGEAAALWRRVAELRVELGQRDRALEAWERAAEAAPQDAGLLSAYAAACRAQGDAPRLAGALRRQIDALPSSPARTDLLYELADLCDDRLADPAGAVRAYQELLSQAPEDRALLKSLQRLYEQTRDAKGLEEVLARDLELARKAGSEEVSALALRLGLLQLERPEEGAKGLQLLGEVLRREPQNPDALVAVGKLAAAPGPLQQEAARLAGPALDKLGNFQVVAQILETQLATQTSAAERAATLRRLADLHEGPLDDPDLAFLAITRALREAPQDPILLRRSLALAEVTGAQEELEALLEELAKAQPPGAAQAELWRALAHSLEGRSQREEAVRAWSQVAAQSPADPEAADRLSASFERGGRFEDLADMLQRQVESASPAQRPAVLARLAAAREKAGQLDEAVSTLRTLYALTQGPDALRALERILGQLGRHLERAEVLKRLATASSGQHSRTELLLRQARAQVQAGEPAQAVAALGELLAAAPDEPRAIPELVSLASEPRARAAALGLLESAFKNPKQAWQRVAILELLVEARSPQEGRALRGELAALHETLGDLRQAFAWRLRLLAEHPEEQGPRVQAERLAQLAHLEEELAGAYQDLLDRQPPVQLGLGATDRALPILEGVLEGSGRFALLGELLSGRIRAAKAAGDEALELELSARVAKIQHRGKDSAAALSTLTSILQRREDYPPAIEVLEEVMRSDSSAAGQAAEVLERQYQRAGAPRLQVEALEVRARWASGEAQLKLLHQLAELQESVLDAPAAAFATLASLLRLQPGDELALENALALAGAAKAEPDLEALLAEIAPRAAKPATRLAMLRQLARLRERLDDPVGALESWRELLALGPDDQEALAASSALLEAAARWHELLGVLERRLTLARGDEERAALLGRIGALRAGSLADAQGAYSAFWSLLQLRPGDLDALAQLDRICQQLQKWPELADVLGRRIRLEPPDRRADLQLRLAQLRRERLGDPAGALPLLGEVLQAQPGHAGALAELERAVAEQPGVVPAEDLLLDAYRHAGDFARLIPLLEACSARAQDKARRRALWLELADLRLEQERDPELAFLALARAYRESPADAALRAKLIALAEAADAQEELVALLDEVIGQLEPAEAAEVCLVAAGLCEGPVREPERAVALYRRAAELSPRIAPRVWPQLDRVLESLGRWEELLPVLDAQERIAAEGPGRVGLLLRIATLAGERLGRPQRAVEAYRAVLQRDPGHLGAARALEALYEQQGQREPLLEILEHLLVHAPADQGSAIRLKLARLCAGTEPERTEALCRQLLAADPLHAEAFALLSERLEKAQRYGELEELLQARLAVTLAPDAIADLEYRLAELGYRRLKRPQPAAVRYRAVLERLPRHQGALVALSEIYESSGSRRELAQVLGQLAQVHEDPKLQRSHHVRHAEVLVELGDAQGAIAAARQALELVPDDEAEIGRLRALLLAQGALPEAARALGLAAGLQRAAGRTGDAVATLFELADIEARRGDPVAAAAALETILVQQPANRRAYDLARALYAGAAEWPALATLFGRFLPNLEGDERLAALDQLVELSESRLADAIDAFGWAKQAVLLDPGSGPRRERLERLARALHRAGELASVYREILARPEPGAGPISAALSLALAAIEDQDLDQVERAEETLHALLARDRGNAAAIDALVQMFSRRELHRKLAEALELRLEASSDPAARVQVLQQLAELWETKLDDLAAAGGALQRRFDAQHDEESARRLVAFHRRHQQWPEALSALLLVRDLVATPQARAQARFEVAELYERELADPESAVAAHLEALRDDPAAPEPFLALERLYGQLERPAELLRAYEHRLAHVGREEKVELLFKSAAVWERRSSPLEADRCLEEVLRLAPREVRAMQELARLRRQGARWKPLVEILTRHVAVAEQPEVRAELCTELGEVSLSHLQDARGAERWWRKAIEHLPTHRPALSALGQLDQREGRWAHAAELLEREAKLEEMAGARAALLHRAAAIREERLGDLVGARRCYGLALKADEDYWPSHRRLRALHVQARAWPEYELSLEHEARRSTSEQERCAAAVELAAHFAQRSQDAGKAIDWYQYALDQRRGALEASLPLADLLVGAQQWARAAGLLEEAVGLLEGSGAGSKGELVRRLCQLGLASQQLKRTQPAIEAYGRALALDSTDPAALRAQLELLDEVGRRAEAADLLQRLLTRHGTGLETGEQVALGVRLGEMYRSLGRAAEAQAVAERALELAPAHAGALHLLVAVCDQLSAFDKAIRYRQKLAPVVGPDERYQLLFELGAIAGQKLSDPRRAIEGYLEALRIRPNALEVLQRLHVAYRDAGQERKAVEALRALLEHPSLPRDEWRRETLALAELLSRLPSGVEAAAEALEAAFDRDPAFTGALQGLEALLGRARQWKRLDACYERAIRRLGEKPEVVPAQAALWRAAGELRLRELRDRPAALAAFEACARLLPGDPQAQEAFADLAMEFHARAQDGVAAYLRALPATAHPEKLCAAVAQVAEWSSDLDSVFLAARAAQLLGAPPTAAQAAALSKLAPYVQAPPELRTPIPEAAWRELLLHPHARGPLGNLLAMLFQWAGTEYGARLGDFKLHPRKHAVELGTASHPALRHLAAVARAMGHPSLSVFSPFLAVQASGQRAAHPDDAAGLRVIPTVPFSLVVGERFLAEPDRSVQSALIGHALAQLRPELAMVLVLGPEHLALLLDAALSLVNERHPSRADPKVLKAERKRLEKAIPSTARSALADAVYAYLRTAGPDDLARYLEGVRLTPLRAALLMAGDFAPVRAHFIPPGPEGEAAIRELAGFALGGELRALRQQTQSQLVARR